MAVYYNEIEPAAAAWLRELIKAGHIAPGEVDERSIEDVIPSELMGFSQCHFFAGIGVWSHALRQAGWPDDRPVWTGSCPCQPFSAAGKGGGTSDERHLWPAFFWLIRQCRPDVVIGEQVEAALRHDWLDHVAVDLEAEGYTVGAVSSPACGYGAPHLRQRLYWMAESKSIRHTRPLQTSHGAKGRRATEHELRGQTRRVADADRSGQLRATEHEDDGEDSGTRRRYDAADNGENAGILGDSGGEGLPEQRSQRGASRGQVGAVQGQAVERTGTPTNGFWRDCEWIPCRDGKARPTGRGIHPLVGRMEHAKLLGCESGQLRMGGEGPESQRAVDTGEQEARTTKSSPLALADGPAAGMVHSGDQGAQADEIDPQNTAEARVMRLRGYGNAIVGPQAEAFIRAYMDISK